jgi:hypothetical protein
VSDVPNALFSTDAERDTFCAKVRLLGIARIEAAFDGSGDSGNMESAGFYDSEGKLFVEDHAALKTMVELREDLSVWDPANLRWVTSQRRAKPVPLDQCVNEMCEAALASVCLDWYNNDGGFGSVVFEFGHDGMEVKMDVHIRVTNTEDSEWEF